MTGEESSELNRDMMDYGLTCLVPWGNYTGGDLVLAQLGLKVEIWPGDVFFSGAGSLLTRLKGWLEKEEWLLSSPTLTCSSASKGRKKKLGKRRRKRRKNRKQEAFFLSCCIVSINGS
jgi:hypothetical protein